MVTPADLNQMLDELWPSARLRCLEVSPDHAVARLEPEPGDLRPGDIISGPTQFGLADSAIWFLASGVLAEVEPMAVTTELSIRFLRPAAGSELFARADLERRGRSSLVATVRVWTADSARPAAVAQGTYYLPQREG